MSAVLSVKVYRLNSKLKHAQRRPVALAHEPDIKLIMGIGMNSSRAYYLFHKA